MFATFKCALLFKKGIALRSYVSVHLRSHPVELSVQIAELLLVCA